MKKRAEKIPKNDIRRYSEVLMEDFGF